MTNTYLQDLQEVFGRKRNEKPRFKGNELYYGLDFSLHEFKKMIGGESQFQKIIKTLKKIIEDDVKKGRKEGYEIPTGKIDYVPDDYATISTSGHPNNLYIQYRLNGHDESGHGMTAMWQLDFKFQKSHAEAASGWDG